MIKTFRFALLACGLVGGGALTATAAPAVPVRVATVELAPHAEERALSPGGSRRSAPSTFARAPKG